MSSDQTNWADLTLDQLRIALAPAVAEAAVFDGWTEAAVASAAAAEGVDPAVAAYAFKGGAMVAIAAWISAVDAAMAEALPMDVLAGDKIRERIRRLVQFRIDALAGPHNVPATLRLSWASADAMWRLAGDTATDYNHYTKRLTLGSLYAATLAVFAHDESEGHAETRAFLERRIDGVMRFEKAKARLFKPSDERFSPARLLGRLRYPAR